MGVFGKLTGDTATVQKKIEISTMKTSDKSLSDTI